MTEVEGQRSWVARAGRHYAADGWTASATYAAVRGAAKMLAFGCALAAISFPVAWLRTPCSSGLFQAACALSLSYKG